MNESRKVKVSDSNGNQYWYDRLAGTLIPFDVEEEKQVPVSETNLRDMFAMGVLSYCLQNPKPKYPDFSAYFDPYEEAYRHAEAMMEARKK